MIKKIIFNRLQNKMGNKTTLLSYVTIKSSKWIIFGKQNSQWRWIRNWVL